MSSFRLAHAAAEDWAHAAKDCTDRLGAIPADTSLGFVYVTDALADDVSSILTYLRQKTGVQQWVGTVGIGICAGAEEYFDRPAVAVMLADFPQRSFCLFPSVSKGPEQLSAEHQAWIASNTPALGLIHCDPTHESLVGLIDGLADATSAYLVGGLTSSRSTCHQVAGRMTGGGISGLLLAPEVPVATGLSQGCAPIGESHVISDCLDNVLIGLDGRRALEVLSEDIGEELSRDIRRVGGLVHAAIPIHGSDTGDYLVRTLVGIDPDRGWLAIAGQVEPGDRIMFVRRDPQSAAKDLRLMLNRLKGRLEGPPRGAVYVSCVARGPNLFGAEGNEMAILREVLGDLPVIGFYANGEVSFNRLYAYTGVLTLFL